MPTTVVRNAMSISCAIVLSAISSADVIACPLQHRLASRRCNRVCHAVACNAAHQGNRRPPHSSVRRGSSRIDIPGTKAWIERWEGRRSHVYNDTAGNPTIGVGFNLNRADARQQIESLGLNYDQVRAGTQDLTDPQIDQLLDHDVNQAIADARAAVSNFDSIPDNKQMVITDMMFNLGASKFAQFHNFISALERQDFQSAADEMVNSQWYQQVGTGPDQRGGADVNKMRELTIPRVMHPAA